MSYYNFNDHFWSPKIVCGQTTVQTPDQKAVFKKIILFCSIICIAISTPLLFNILSKISDINQDNKLTNIYQSNCFMLPNNQGRQIYCSNSQR